MSELTYKECKVGMQVALTKPCSSYTIGRGNPKVGTNWECIGKITNMCDGSIDVAWENGAYNTYKSRELSVAHDGRRELSVAHDGRCKSIWDEDG